MFRKIAVIIPMFLFCLALDNCKSPEGPEEPNPNYEYRYNVEVIYTRTTQDIPAVGSDRVSLWCSLYNPPSNVGKLITGDMDKIAENKFRYYLPEVFIQTPLNPDKHKIHLNDYTIISRNNLTDDIYIQGAYDLEIEEEDWSGFIRFYLKFKMSKNQKLTSSLKP